MEDYEKLLNDIRKNTEKIAELDETLYTLYAHAVKEAMAGRLTDEESINCINDGLIDLGRDRRYFELSKKMWACIYRQHPQLIPKGFNSIYRLASIYLEEEEDDDIP